MTTTTRKACEIKGGDQIRLDCGVREVFDAYPYSGTTYVIRWLTAAGRVHSLRVATDADVTTV